MLQKLLKDDRLKGKVESYQNQWQDFIVIVSKKFSNRRVSKKFLFLIRQKIKNSYTSSHSIRIMRKKTWQIYVINDKSLSKFSSPSLPSKKTLHEKKSGICFRFLNSQTSEILPVFSLKHQKHKNLYNKKKKKSYTVCRAHPKHQTLKFKIRIIA